MSSSLLDYYKALTPSKKQKEDAGKYDVDKSVDKSIRPVDKPVGKSDNEISQFIAGCKAKEENYAYLEIEFESYLTPHSVVERPFKNENDSYGGSWGCGGQLGTNKEEVEEYIRGYKRDMLEQPYLSRGHPAFSNWARDIRAENIRVFASKRAVEYMMVDLGVDFDKLQGELDALPENPASENFIRMLEREAELKELIGELERKRDEYEDTIRARFKMGKKETYYKDEPKEATHLIGASADDLQREFTEIKSKLESSEKEFTELQKELR